MIRDKIRVSTTSMRKTVFIIITCILIACILFFGLKKNNTAMNQVKSSIVRQFNTSISHTSPTPFPFQELTIPYLRNREYKGTLGAREKSYETAEYTAYFVSYSSDGLKINGILTEPKGEKPAGGWPAIVFIHGYIPPTQYQTEERYYDYVDYLAQNGFVVFKIDLRGHGNSEGNPTGAYFSSDYIIDTLNAYKTLQKLDIINPQKIGLWGHSMAGNIVLRSMAANPAIPAGVIWAGAVYTYQDMRDYGINDNSYRPQAQLTLRQSQRQRLRNIYGDYATKSAFWKQVAPTNYLSDLKGAIQLHHADNDTVVSIEYSKNLNNLLNKTSVPHEFKEYSSGGHNISDISFNEAMANTVNFYNQYLKK